MTLDQLDRLAAKEIMGWPEEIIDNRILTRLALGPGNQFDWQPTRNIAQAWECLEKVFVDTCTMTVQVSRICDNKYPELKGWCLHVDNMSYELYSPTAQEAIVRACLKAKGIDLDAE